MPTGDGGMSEMPPGDGEMPEMPPGDGGMPGGMSEFVESGETITFEITDSTTITVEFLQGTSEGTIDSIAVGSILEVTLNGSNATKIIVRNLQTGGGFGGSGTVTNGTSANIIDEDSIIVNETYTSSGNDENALRIDGAIVTLDGITVEKTGGESSNTEDGDFYGQNAGLLVLNGATVTITNSTITTNAVNGNALFSYGEGTTVTISDSVIRTTARNSGGIQTTGGGTMNAINLDVETQGNSAAAIRSDRGGGIVTVTGGTYTSNGLGSPAIYSTADISVSDAVLTATGSEAIVVEGKNSVSLTNCTLTGNMSGTYADDNDENIHNIMIYQSMSGDADIGKATFSATGGSIISQNGDMIYVTNTGCTIKLNNVELILSNDTLLRVEGNSSSRGWGTEGANGGDAVFTAIAQVMKGNIYVDEISSLEISITDGTLFEGTINPDGEGGEVNVTLDESSTWTLTGDSYVRSFDGDVSNIVSNGYTLYVNGVAQ
jgi:hypothetical protein